MKILHVTDCFNGGVQEIIEEIIQAVPQCDHYLLFDVHDYDPHIALNETEKNFRNAQTWKRGAWKRIKHLRKVVREETIDFVHLHSSRAGLYGRISLPQKLVLYSSHGFGFERKDISIFFRIAIFMIEFLLSFRTHTYIANWPHEYIIAKRLIRKRVMYAPIIIDKLFANLNPRTFAVNETIQIATIGRITQAKDPEFFAKLTNRVVTERKIQWHWLGDGDVSMRQNLDASGVQVSGWLSRNELIERLKNIEIVLVTSKWDAGPIALYLAISLGIPVVVRDFPAGKILGFRHGWTVDELSLSIQDLVESQEYESVVGQQRSQAEKLMNRNAPKNLVAVYSELQT